MLHNGNAQNSLQHNCARASASSCLHAIHDALLSYQLRCHAHRVRAHTKHARKNDPKLHSAQAVHMCHYCTGLAVTSMVSMLSTVGAGATQFSRSQPRHSGTSLGGGGKGGRRSGDRTNSSCACRRARSLGSFTASFNCTSPF